MNTLFIRVVPPLDLASILRHLSSQLRPPYLPPGPHTLHQVSHVQVTGDGHGLVQRSYCVGSVIFSITFSEHIGIVATGPGQFDSVARLPAESKSILEVGPGLIQITDCLGREAENTVRLHSEELRS